jgi:hypothetical protein
MPITKDELEVLRRIFGTAEKAGKINSEELIAIARAIYNTVLSARLDGTITTEKLMVIGKFIFAGVKWEQFPAELNKPARLPFVYATNQFFIPDLLNNVFFIEEENERVEEEPKGELDEKLSAKPVPASQDAPPPWYPSEESKITSAEPAASVNLTSIEPPLAESIITEGEIGGPGSPEEDAMLIENAATEAALEAKAQKALEDAQGAKKEKEASPTATEEPRLVSEEPSPTTNENPIP